LGENWVKIVDFWPQNTLYWHQKTLRIVLSDRLLAGLLVGRPMRYSREERQALREIVLARTSRFDFPIITDMDFGHTAPQMTLPLGCRAMIDGDQQRFAIVDGAVT